MEAYEQVSKEKRLEKFLFSFFSYFFSLFRRFHREITFARLLLIYWLISFLAMRGASD